MRDHGRNPANPRRLAICLAGVAFVADGGAGLYIRANVEQGFEMTSVRRLAAGQIEGDDIARRV